MHTSRHIYEFQSGCYVDGEMAASNAADDKTFAGLLLKDIKETGKEFGVGAYGRVFAVDYNGVVCAAKEVHPI